MSPWNLSKSRLGHHPAIKRVGSHPHCTSDHITEESFFRRWIRRLALLLRLKARNRLRAATGLAIKSLACIGVAVFVFRCTVGRKRGSRQYSCSSRSDTRRCQQRRSNAWFKPEQSTAPACLADQAPQHQTSGILTIPIVPTHIGRLVVQSLSVPPHRPSSKSAPGPTAADSSQFVIAVPGRRGLRGISLRVFKDLGNPKSGSPLCV